MAAICVFCGSQTGDDIRYVDDAAQLGRFLSSAGHTLIYGGGSTGIMGAIADAMLAENGHVIGVIPEALAVAELMHNGVDDMRVVPDMHVRKATMHRLADAYIALPGGLGTMEELFEALCWAQLEFHTAPICLLNSTGIFEGLVKLLDRMVQDHFVSPKHHSLLTVCNSVNELEGWIRRQFPDC
ncbi:MAG: TIGR00730 family Rossman fold protein [Planctomycetaceae bacterium]